MKINKYNEEGYHDPTPYEAFTSIEAERRAAQPPPSAAKPSPSSAAVLAFFEQAKNVPFSILVRIFAAWFSGITKY